jgi:hypothetical protein
MQGKSEEVLGDFIFLYIPLNFYVHLLIYLPKVDAPYLLNKWGRTTWIQGWVET